MSTTDATHRLALLERDRLTATLGTIEAAEWATPSLCTGWSVREVVAHLLMPYELSLAGTLGRMVRSRFDFDAVAGRWAQRDSRSPAELLEALNMIHTRRFGSVGVPQVAGLSHLVAHGGDIYRPLVRPHLVDPEAGRIVLHELVTRGKRTIRPGVLDGRAFRATDTTWSHGAGPAVEGTAAALIVTLLGRDAAWDELTGDGVPGLRAHLGSASAPHAGR